MIMIIDLNSNVIFLNWSSLVFAKGSPVPKRKMKTQSKSSKNNISKVITFSTNEKAAHQVPTNGSSLEISHTPSEQTISVGKFTPVKRKFPEGGRGEVKSLVNIFEHGISKPTWNENISESPAKRQCSRGAK